MQCGYAKKICTTSFIKIPICINLYFNLLTLKSRRSIIWKDGHDSLLKTPNPVCLGAGIIQMHVVCLDMFITVNVFIQKGNKSKYVYLPTYASTFLTTRLSDGSIPVLQKKRASSLGVFCIEKYKCFLKKRSLNVSLK